MQGILLFVSRFRMVAAVTKRFNSESGYSSENHWLGKNCMAKEIVKTPKSRVSVESMQNLKAILPALKRLIDAVEGETKKKSLLLTFASFEKKILNIKPETGTAIKALKEAMKAGKKITIEE